MESTATPRQLSLGWPRALGMHGKDSIHPIGGTVRTLLRRHEDLLFLLLSLLPKCRFVLLGDCLPSLWLGMLQTAPAHPCSPYQTDPGPELSWLRFGELGAGMLRSESEMERKPEVPASTRDEALFH